jgi:hypothetical protein
VQGEQTSTMGGGKGVVDGAAEVLSGIAYIAYILVGFALFASGIIYYSQITGANQSTSAMLIFPGPPLPHDARHTARGATLPALRLRH